MFCEEKNTAPVKEIERTEPPPYPPKKFDLNGKAESFSTF